MPNSRMIVCPPKWIRNVPTSACPWGATVLPTFTGTIIASGSVTFNGQDLLALTERQMRSVRGGKISMVFQEPMSSLNPVFTCGNQIMEALQLHRNIGGHEARELAEQMLDKVGIPEPAQRLREYPHQLSGGMRQRVMIAMALSCNPQLLIADEPTTALDVTIQAQILDLLKDIQQREHLSVLLITHDLAVVAETAHTVGVMYASNLVELTRVHTLFDRPLHPYTKGLFRSLPRLGEQKHRLETIPGTVPNPLHFPSGCKFHPRCPQTREAAASMSDAETLVIADGERCVRQCAEEMPPLREVRPGHWAACWLCEGFADAPETDPSAAKDEPTLQETPV